MICNPFARLISSSIVFLILIVLIEEWITIELRGFINRRRMKYKKYRGE